LSDSQAYRAFCRFEVVGPPLKKSTLQENVALLSPATWEKLNEVVVARAKAIGIESGKKVRVDCTPVESNIHAPTDSSLLWDVVRVLGRSLERSRKFVRMAWLDQRKLAKHRYIGIVRAPSAMKRRALYVQLLKITERMIASAERAATALRAHASDAAQELGLRIQGFVASGRRVIEQTRRRVVLEESVPVGEKIVSIFETHTDILVKA